MAGAEESDGVTEDNDPRGRPLALADAVPPVRWPLSLLAGVCCATGAGWVWASSGQPWMAAVASVAAAGWLLFAIVGVALGRGRRAGAEKGDHLVK